MIPWLDMIARKTVLLPTLALFAACAATKPPAAESARSSGQPCGDAEAVSVHDRAATGGVFARLAAVGSVPLTFRCAGSEPCVLPSDRRLELRVTPRQDHACAFAACRVPYLGTLPIGHPDERDPCPRVLWSLATVTLKSDGGALDEEVAEVNVLASPAGEGFLRFMIESPRGLARMPAQSEPRSLLLDVQLELAEGRVRGQMSALAAPTPHEPASELRFQAIWSATWESEGGEGIAEHGSEPEPSAR